MTGPRYAWPSFLNHADFRLVCAFLIPPPNRPILSEQDCETWFAGWLQGNAADGVALASGFVTDARFDPAVVDEPHHRHDDKESHGSGWQKK